MQQPLGWAQTLLTPRVGEWGGDPSGVGLYYRLPGRSSPCGGSSRGVGGVVGVAPRLSGRSSPGGVSSLGGTSSALGGPGGTTTVSGGVGSSTPSSGAGVVGAVSSLALLRSSQKASALIVSNIRTAIPGPTSLP